MKNRVKNMEFRFDNIISRMIKNGYVVIKNDGRHNQNEKNSICKMAKMIFTLLYFDWIKIY